MAQEIAELQRAKEELLEALEGVEAMVVAAQMLLTDYLILNGITDTEVISGFLFLLDGPEQREAQGKSKAAIEAHK